MAIIILANEVFGQCPTSGTVLTSCVTVGNLTLTGDLTVNAGVTMTVTGNLTINGGKTLTATGGSLILGSFTETWGGTNTLIGGTYTVTNDFSSGSGGAFVVSGVTADINGAVSFQGSSHSYTNSSFDIAEDLYFGSGTHTVNNTFFDVGTGYTNTTGHDALSFNGGATVNFSNNAGMDVKGDVNAGNSASLSIDNSDVYVTGNFDNAGSGNIVVTNGGTFVVDGDYDNSGSGSTTVEDGGHLEVGGDYDNTGGGSSNVNGGTMVVGGNYSGNAPSGDSGDCSGGGGGCCGSGCAALPVTLIDFSGASMPGGICLSWSTASEVNNDYFTLEHSADGVSFAEIAQVSGKGTTSEISAYSYTDRVAQPGVVYYRLSQTDFDGTQEVLGVVSARSTSNHQLSIAPNPIRVGGELQILGLTEGATFYVYHLDGRLQNVYSYSPGMRLSQLEPGTYMVTLQGHAQHRDLRLVVK
ncbi:T9SS type A sorting domain-containing protein [Marinoscillum furvescens]|uniref:T9SS type A sorting domain-containing protein n=1 Tax=Marinoscillum furvescens TaxID=1026 RepID=UPI0011C01B34|nr:T9SS type A sorting domain-containing protein [Marinoscillum furvescens]